MKRFLLRSALLIGIGSMVLMAGYGLTLMDSKETPEGQFASDSLLPHSPNDLLEFRSGRVLWKTCCGTEDYGTYLQEASGQWIWKMTLQTRRAKNPALRQYAPITRLILHPGRFTLGIEPEDRSFPIETIRRRLFEKVNF